MWSLTPARSVQACHNVSVCGLIHQLGCVPTFSRADLKEPAFTLRVLVDQSWLLLKARVVSDDHAGDWQNRPAQVLGHEGMAALEQLLGMLLATWAVAGFLDGVKRYLTLG